ncbi:hypothetical protein [Candidatus Amarobacter glycogenicus]|uniref:hypothetical protein n=1 Tax=Candidatus Amarobacter glycogenicus TaxID=3140699 RepID=UPI0031362BEE|nr:hypothetical protein [Dehalococcoidia bacterium]
MTLIFFVLEDTLLQDLTGAQAVAAMDQVTLLAKRVRKERFLALAIAAADHHHLTTTEGEAIAGRTIAFHAAAGQPFSPGTSSLRDGALPC